MISRRASRESMKGLVVIAAVAMTGASSHAQDAKQLAYGKHLAAECTTCHRIDGTDNGIPSIIGWDHKEFVATLSFYKQGLRTNPAMKSVADSLEDDQVEALAVFFGSLPKPPKKGK